MSLTAKEFSLMLKANQGKAPKPFCIAAKLLLKTEESGNLDVDLFKEVLQLLPKEEDAKKVGRLKNLFNPPIVQRLFISLIFRAHKFWAPSLRC